MNYEIIDNRCFKLIKSENLNMFFDKKTGFTITFGKTKDDDPQFSEFGPFIADIEISTICSGVGSLCKFCYKANTPKGANMTIETFCKIADKLPKSITQIAVGLGNLPEHKYYKKIIT